MGADTLTLRSSISPQLMRHTLWRGSIIAIIGASALALAGAFLPPNELNVWGLPLFLSSTCIITFGLLPLRRLKKLEVNPYELIVDNNQIVLRKSGKTLQIIPTNTIADLKYRESDTAYGIDILLNDKTLFLPYFSKRSFDTLKPLIAICREA